jgi:hypothetical protein
MVETPSLRGTPVATDPGLVQVADDDSSANTKKILKSRLVPDLAATVRFGGDSALSS